MLAVSRDPGLALSLQATVRRGMQAPGVVKLGFAMQEDLRRLEAALPGATDGAESLFDLQPGATRALGNPKRKVAGLGAACQGLLAMAVDKQEQTSDWGARPLTASQLGYVKDNLCHADAVGPGPSIGADGGTADPPPPRCARGRSGRPSPPRGGSG